MNLIAKSTVLLACVSLGVAGCGTGSDPTASASARTKVVAGAAGGSSGDQLTPIVVRITNAPHPALGTDGRVHLAYELLLSNVISSDATITGIEVVGDGTSVQSLDADGVKNVIKIFGAAPGNSVLGAGQQALVWLDAAVASYREVPTRLVHRVHVTVAKPQLPLIPASFVETVATTKVPDDEPIVIGAPLAGPNWLDGNSCCAVTPHRAAVNPINGKLWVPERYAIDYVQLDAQNRIFDGPNTAIASYKYFGANIHAVAEGKIVSMVTDQKEQDPGANPTGLLIDQYGGNYIVQDIGDGHYAFYAHLQPGNPLHVKVGQHLERGAVIGLLGNTGNTDGPHLHFHIMDSPDPLASNGLPFAIDRFRFQGKASSEANLFDAASKGVPIDIDASGAGKRKKISPLYLDIMSYAP